MAEMTGIGGERDATLEQAFLLPLTVTPGPSTSLRRALTPGSRFSFLRAMDRERLGGWVCIMADRYRSAMHVGVTTHLAARIHQHREGTGSDFCARYDLKLLVWAERGDRIEDCIAHEKRFKRWRRAFKFDLIERGNPDWEDLNDVLV
jgi:putative endonuclease